ncbi:MAG: RES family NAD+ phosphorylase [Bryobacteraceae bacterium]
MTEQVPLPPVSLIRRYDTHRLILSKYNPDLASVLVRISDDDGHLQAIFDLEGITNDRLWGEDGLLPEISRDELVFGVPNSHVINATFTHAHPNGSRFNGPNRGAWYAGFDLETSQTEVAFHKSIEYAEINVFEDSVTYDDYLADFSGNFHDIRESPEFAFSVDPDSYVDSQELAEHLLDAGSLGIVYPSVRRTDGTCLACFRPALVGNVRKDKRYRFTWAGEATPEITCEST